MRQILYILYQFLIALPILLVLTLLTSLITFATFFSRNGKFPHTAQVYWARCVYYLLGIKMELEDDGLLQSGQSYVFVSNHQSFLDVFAIYGWLPVTFKWMMKKELRCIPVVGTACLAAGHIFVDRSNPRAAMESIRMIESEISNGISTVIFPEGTRTTTGNVGPFKRGAFKVATDLHLPIVPVSLTGCYEAMPKGKYFVRTRAHVRMKIGEPIDMTTFSSIDEAIQFVRERVIEGMK